MSWAFGGRNFERQLYVTFVADISITTSPLPTFRHHPSPQLPYFKNHPIKKPLLIFLVIFLLVYIKIPLPMI
jgi:hypothetical protein